MRTPPPELPGHAIEPSVRPVVLPLLPPFPRQPARRRRRPLPDAVAVRRIPLPESAPPYDDQADESWAAAGGPPDAAGSPEWQCQPAGRQPAGPQPAGPQPVSAPGAEEWRGQFAQVLAETLAGSRPPRQMTPWTTEQARKRIRELGPMLQGDQRPRVRRIITSAPDNGVVEMTVVIGVGPRVRALAVRLERTGSGQGQSDQARWRCTAIEAA